MIFIIEGIDKAGKSTLINELAREYPGIVMKIVDRPRNSAYQEREKIKNYYTVVMNTLVLNKGKNFILDRYYPSEICYSPKRGYEAKEDPFFLILEKDLKRKFGNDILFVFCNPGQDEIGKRFGKEPDDHVSLDEALEILERYEEFFDKTILNKIMVDSRKDPKVIVEQIKKHLES